MQGHCSGKWQRSFERPGSVPHDVMAARKLQCQSRYFVWWCLMLVNDPDELTSCTQVCHKEGSTWFGVVFSLVQGYCMHNRTDASCFEACFGILMFWCPFFLTLQHIEWMTASSLTDLLRDVLGRDSRLPYVSYLKIALSCITQTDLFSLITFAVDASVIWNFPRITHGATLITMAEDLIMYLSLFYPEDIRD